MSIILYPYKRGLDSIANLRDAGCPIRYSTSRVTRGVACTWGNRKIPSWANKVRWINHPSAVPMVADKMNWANLCFLAGFGLRYTTDRRLAQDWANPPGGKVVCRTVLNGKGGAGIVIARNAEQVIDAPLYSAYQRKTREYRVIYSPVTGVVHAASKRRRPDFNGDRDDLLVRTKDRGWVYQTETDVPGPVVAAVGAVGQYLASYGLRLLAYDVIYDSNSDTATVVEANTAPGLSTAATEATYAAMQTIGESL